MTVIHTLATVIRTLKLVACFGTTKGRTPFDPLFLYLDRETGHSETLGDSGGFGTYASEVVTN